jgi:CubicO group peptidase (beta-lactamase class C family)
MRTLVFDPLGMKSTTFDFKRAQTGNFAAPRAQDVDGKTMPVLVVLNDAVIPVRPAGASSAT